MKPKIRLDNPNSTNEINFDDFFHKKVQTIINSLPKPTLPPLTIPTFSFNLFDAPSTAHIENLLSSVKSTCMLGPVPLYLFRPLSPFLSPYYKYI